MLIILILVVGEDVPEIIGRKIMSNTMAQGVIIIHSAPASLCPHVEWALGSVLEQRMDLHWSEQPVSPGMYRAEISWAGHPGDGALLASAVRGWAHLRYEITEDATPGNDASRWAHTPELGVFHAHTDSLGNIVVSEDRIRYAYEVSGGDGQQMCTELSLALGEAWDEELEPFRHAGEGAPVRWLHRVS